MEKTMEDSDKANTSARSNSRKRKADDAGDDDGTGDADVPRAITILEFAAARASEMEALTFVSNRVNAKKTIQMPSRHMRRRAASHDVKRLPRRLREKAKKEMIKSGPPLAKKRPSRQHRRRAGNLVEEYARRAKNNVWLETHIWHAKRFHMTNMWGYRLPLHPNDKGIRAAYRAVSHYCLMQDVSYLCCVELQGFEQTLLKQLARLLSPDTGPTLGATCYIKGTREGSTVLYRHDSYPRNAIGPVKFLWCPLVGLDHTEIDVRVRQLWLWVHPACYSELMMELKIVFNIPHQATYSGNQPSLSKDQNQSLASSSEKLQKHERKKSKSKQTRTSMDDKKCVDDVRPSPIECELYASGDVIIKSLKDVMCRFQLSGPLSTSILTDLLKPAQVKSETETNCKDEECTDPADCPLSNGQQAGAQTLDKTGHNESQRWWEKFYTSHPAREVHRHQSNVWGDLRGLQSPAELSPHVVLPLTVRDPRIFLPRKKTRVANDIAAISERTLDAVRCWPVDVTSSPLWDTQVRQTVKATKLSEQQMNRLRERHLVPGTELNLGEDESRVPVILIQNPGVRHNPGKHPKGVTPGAPVGWGCGWDVILPQGWAMAFWVGLVYRGARVGGLQEGCSTATQEGRVAFPESYPDTAATISLEEDQARQLEEKYNRIPPAKRPNYVKLGVVAPFRYPWQQLVSDWNSGSNGPAGSADSGSNCSDVCVAVLRNRNTLKALDRLCTPTLVRAAGGMGQGKSATSTSLNNPTDCQVKGQSMQILNSFTEEATNLVSVRIHPIGRGTPTAHTMICIPSPVDLEELVSDCHHPGPVEPIHSDPAMEAKKAKKKKKPQTVKEGEVDSSIRESSLVSVRQSCSRAVIGFIKQGGFHFPAGQGHGVGFVVLQGLVSLLRDKAAGQHPVVLIRSSHSLQYRYATLSIIL